MPLPQDHITYPGVTGMPKVSCLMLDHTKEVVTLVPWKHMSRSERVADEYWQTYPLHVLCSANQSPGPIIGDVPCLPEFHNIDDTYRKLLGDTASKLLRFDSEGDIHGDSKSSSGFSSGSDFLLFALGNDESRHDIVLRQREGLIGKLTSDIAYNWLSYPSPVQKTFDVTVAAVQLFHGSRAPQDLLSQKQDKAISQSCADLDKFLSAVTQVPLTSLSKTLETISKTQSQKPVDEKGKYLHWPNRFLLTITISKTVQQRVGDKAVDMTLRNRFFAIVVMRSPLSEVTTDLAPVDSSLEKTANTIRHAFAREAGLESESKSEDAKDNLPQLVQGILKPGCSATVLGLVNGFPAKCGETETILKWLQSASRLGT
jgi:hypothetical protein